MKQYFSRFLAAALGLYFALGMSRAATGLLDETKRVSSLLEACSRTEADISALRDARSMSDEAVRQWAFQQKGMVSPYDTVFFDRG